MFNVIFETIKIHKMKDFQKDQKKIIQKDYKKKEKKTDKENIT